MISYLTLGTNDLPAASRFYDTLMTAMGASKVGEWEKGASWGFGIGTPMLILIKPFDQQPASVGNGTMVSFDAASPQQVQQWHALVLASGGSNEGDPGMRGEAMYVGYCRDPEGNKLNFIHHLPPAQ